MGRVIQYQCDVDGCDHKSKDPHGWWRIICYGAYKLDIDQLARAEVNSEYVESSNFMVCGMVCLHKKISELLGETNGKSH